MRPAIVWTLARYEVRASLRNRWFVLYAAAFVLLAVALSGLSLSGSGIYGVAGFGRTAASLINLVLLIVPLMGLSIGAQGLAAERERGTLAYLLTQPIGRAELLVGKYVGLAAALSAALLCGFGLSAALIARQGGLVDTGSYAALVGFALLLALAALGLGLLISAWSRTSALAVGVALFVWLSLVFLGDLGLMGTAVVLRIQIGLLLILALLNPLQVFKIAAVYSLRANLELLGPAGIYATRTYGDGLLWLLAAILLLWSVAAVAGAYLRLRSEGDL